MCKQVVDSRKIFGKKSKTRFSPSKNSMVPLDPTSSQSQSSISTSKTSAFPLSMTNYTNPSWPTSGEWTEAATSVVSTLVPARSLILARTPTCWTTTGTWWREEASPRTLLSGLRSKPRPTSRRTADFDPLYLHLMHIYTYLSFIGWGDDTMM